jgi:hypothetical protein
MLTPESQLIQQQEELAKEMVKNADLYDLFKLSMKSAKDNSFKMTDSVIIQELQKIRH